ncbi:MAG TPA: hypothetical protein VMG36_06080 [Thermoplasmata archaeon]|nr:hypothetical protein [Thermoplasmata archaeon]
MTASLSNADTTALLVIVLLVLFMARRTYRLSQGTPYSSVRIFGYGAYSTVLFAVLAATTIYVAVGAWGTIAFGLVAVYAAVGIAVGAVVIPRVRRVVQFEPHPDGRLYYRLPVIIPALSLVLFVVRVGVEIGLFGLASIATFSLPTSVSPGALYLLIGADLLFVGSVGLLYGRALGVRAGYAEFVAHRTPAGAPSATPPPLP